MPEIRYWHRGTGLARGWFRTVSRARASNLCLIDSDDGTRTRGRAVTVQIGLIGPPLNFCRDVAFQSVHNRLHARAIPTEGSFCGRF